jgi:hypothetical protein
VRPVMSRQFCRLRWRQGQLASRLRDQMLPSSPSAGPDSGGAGRGAVGSVEERRADKELQPR